MELYKHQQEFIEALPKRYLLCWDCGTGKTLGSIRWAEAHGGTTLYVSPKSVVDKWGKEIKEYSEFDTTFDNSYVISKETFRRDWEKLPRFDNIVVDEAHYFAGMRNAKQISQMAKALFGYVRTHKEINILLATATPYLSTPFNIYMLAKILGHDWNYHRFKNKYFEDVYFGPRPVSRPRAGIEDEMADLVREIGSVIHINECADIPDQVFETEEYGLSNKQIKAIENIDEPVPVVRFTIQHQIENGTLKGNEYVDDMYFPSPKEDRILDLMENNKKIAVVCRYNLQIARLQELAETKLKKKVYVINGATKDKYGVSQEVEQSDDCVVLINAMASEAYELPSVGVCVFASMSYSYKDFKQILGRFLRLNRLKKNVYIHLITKGGIDEAVFDSISRKQDFDLAIYAQNQLS